MSNGASRRNLICAAGAALVATAFGTTSFAQQTGPIKIGLLVPLTGPLAAPGIDMVDGFKLYWEQVGNMAGGRKVEYVIADTTCNPDQAITQARRLVHQEKVHIMIGPLCGHEGPAVAQVSKETGVPLVMDTAGADNVTKWDRTPTVVRTAVSASQIGHPFGDYLYKELGAAQRHLHRSGLHLGPRSDAGHGADLQGARRQGRARSSGIRSAPRTMAPTVASIAPGSDAVVAVVVGADRIRLFEAWFSFGMDKKFKIYGGYWMHQDALPQMDDRAIGMIGNSLHYAAGLDTPANRAFVDAFAKKHKRLPSWFSESAYTASLWTRTAIEKIKGNVEDRAAFLQAMRTVNRQGAARHAQAGRLRQPDPERLRDAHPEDQSSVGWRPVLTNVPIKTYENVSQFWTWTPEEFLKRGPYKR